MSNLSCRTSVWICRRTLWFLHREHIRLGTLEMKARPCYYSSSLVNYRIEYHWQELWRALFGLLDFLANKMDSLITAGDIVGLVEEVSSMPLFARDITASLTRT